MSYKAKIKDIEDQGSKPTASKSLPPVPPVHMRSFKDASSNTVDPKKGEDERGRRDQAPGSPPAPREPSPPASPRAVANLNHREEIGLQCSLSLCKEENSLILVNQDGLMRSPSFEQVLTRDPLGDVSGETTQINQKLSVDLDIEFEKA